MSGDSPITTKGDNSGDTSPKSVLAPIDEAGQELTGTKPQDVDKLLLKTWQFPSSEDLLLQINQDETKKVEEMKQHNAAPADIAVEQRNAEKQKETIKTLSETDRKTIGKFADALAASDWEAIGKIIRGFRNNVTGDPGSLQQLIDPMCLEIERRGLDKRFDLRGFTFSWRRGGIDVYELDENGQRKIGPEGLHEFTTDGQ